MIQTRRNFIGKTVAASLGGAIAVTLRLQAQTPSEGNGGVLLYSGWATKNIGDIGHTPGTLRYLEEYCPEIPVTLWLRRGNEAVIAMLNKRFPSVEIVQGNLDSKGRADSAALQSAFDECSLFVHNSGMAFNQFWPPPRQFVDACILRNKPFGLYGQSFDGFSPEDEAEMAALFSNAAFIYTRDAESLFYLRKIGVRPDVLEFGPDGCFGIDVRDNERGDGYLKEVGLEKKGYITVTIRTHTAGDLKESKDSEGDLERAKKLREVIESWVLETGKKVLLAPEVEKEIVAAKSLLYDPLPPGIKRNVVWRDIFWNVDEAVSVYANAIAMVSMEPHSLIMGLAFGTPGIHYFLPQHSVKGWMFRDIGLPEWLMEIMKESPRNVTDALIKIDENYPLAQLKARRAMRYVEQRSAGMMAVIKQYASQ